MEDMKILILTKHVLFFSFRMLFAGDWDSCESLDVKKSTPEIVLTSNNLQLLKYTDHNGTTRFTIKNLDDSVIEENMNRLELRIDFLEMEKNSIVNVIRFHQVWKL